jgi:hypothetical protein
MKQLDQRVRRLLPPSEGVFLGLGLALFTMTGKSTARRALAEFPQRPMNAIKANVNAIIVLHIVLSHQRCPKRNRGQPALPRPVFYPYCAATFCLP